jgi:hypothetical protein
MKRAAALGLALALLACSSDGFSPAPPSERRPEPVYQEIRPVPGGDDGRMFYPDRSTSCDRATQICYVGGKANVAATERFLGDDAAKELKKHVVDAQKEPKWVFEPDGDTSCDLRTQVCYGLKGPNVNKTRKYFGEDAAARLEKNLGGGTVTTPKKKVGCDASVKVCYDENGPSVKLTKQYFGDEAAKKLKKQMPR